MVVVYWLQQTREIQMDFSQALRIVKDEIHESELKDYDKKRIIFDLIWLENELTTNNKGEK